MKFLLLEKDGNSVSRELQEFLASWKDQSQLEKYFDTKTNVFKDVGNFLKEVLKIKDSKIALDIVSKAINLTKTDRNFSKYIDDFLSTYLRLAYPLLTQDELTFELLETSINTDGYKLNPSTNELTFKDRFIETYIDNFETYAKDNVDTSSFLFSYLIVNLDKKNLSLDDVNDIVDHLKVWFKSDYTNDIRYKVDQYIWTLDNSNPSNYGIKTPDNKPFTFYTLVDPKSKAIGNDAPNGVQFGTLDADVMKQWMEQFTKTKKKINLYNFLADKQDPPIIDYNTFYKHYKVIFDKIDASKTEVVLNFLKTLEGRDWAGHLKQITFDQSPSHKEILDKLYEYIDESKKDPAKKDQNKKDNPEKSSNETESSETSDDVKKPTTGIQLIKRLKKISSKTKTISPVKIQEYVTEVAAKHGLQKDLSKLKDWNKLYAVLQKPLDYTKEVRGSDVSALENLITDYLRGL